MNIIKLNFKKDKQSKSLSYFIKKNKKILINELLIKEIKKIAFKSKKNLRINLHANPNSKFHNMIIFHWKNTYYKPHKHILKEETCHMIKGKQKIITLDGRGKIITNQLLDDKKNIIFRIEKNTFHTSKIISKYVIFHESKPGPYLGIKDSILPKWAQKFTKKYKQNSLL